MKLIYKISNSVNSKVYIGSTKDYEGRKKQHLYLLERGKHHSTYLQNFYSKYDCEFTFSIVEIVEDEKLLWERESFWMEFYRSFDPTFGFNCSVNPRNSKRINPIAQYSIKGEFIQVFDNIQKAKIWMKENGKRWSDQPYKRSQVGGFQWKKCDLYNIPQKIESLETFFSYYDDEGIYQGYRDSLDGLKNKSNMRRAIENGTKYLGYYWKQTNEISKIKKKINIRKRETTAREVIIYNKLHGKIFPSLTEAAEFLETSVHSIGRVLSDSPKLKKYQTIKGYSIKYGD